MAKPHDCETFDFPVKAAVFSYKIKVKIPKGLGGTWKQAMQVAIQKARDKATADGEAAMKGESCEEPCDCIIFVDVSIRDITPFKDPGVRNVEITVTGIWEAGILCFKKPEKSDSGKSGKPEQPKESRKPKKPKSEGKSK